LASEYNDEKLAEAVRTMEDLVDEAVQLYELDKEKTNVIDDLYNSLKIITTFLSFWTDIHPQLLNLPEGSRVILTPNLDIHIIMSDYKFQTRRLDELTLDEISNVLRYVVPVIVNAARSERRINSKRIAVLRESAKRLKRLPTASPSDTIITDTSIHMEKVDGK